MKGLSDAFLISSFVVNFQQIIPNQRWRQSLSYKTSDLPDSIGTQVETKPKFALPKGISLNSGIINTQRKAVKKHFQCKIQKYSGRNLPFPPLSEKRYLRPYKSHIRQHFQLLRHIIKNIPTVIVKIAFVGFQPSWIVMRMRN